MNDTSNIVALILQFQKEEGGISRVLQRVTRDTYENFALQSRHVFSPFLKSKLSRHSARFIRNRNPRYPFSHFRGIEPSRISNIFLRFPIPFRRSESVLFFEALHKGMHLSRGSQTMKQTIPPFDRLSPLVQSGIHTFNRSRRRSINDSATWRRVMAQLLLLPC